MSDDGPRTWTMDDDSYASNPGRLKVQRLRWFRFHPFWSLVWIGLTALMISFALRSNPFWWAGVGLCLGCFSYYWKRVEEQFVHGCVNAAQVVALKPTRIAVSTDLGNSGPVYPALKVIPTGLTSIDGKPLEVGQRLATVSVYGAGEDESLDRWVDFFPALVDCATTDPEARARIFSSITEEEWANLDSALSQVDDPTRPALHELWNTSP